MTRGLPVTGTTHSVFQHSKYLKGKRHVVIQCISRLTIHNSGESYPITIHHAATASGGVHPLALMMTRYAARRGAAVHGVDEGHWEALLLILTGYVDTSFS